MSVEFEEGTKVPAPIYEGTATRTDVLLEDGIARGGVVYADQIDEEAMHDLQCYVKQYTSFDDMAYQQVANAELGNVIVGRLLTINRIIPEIAANGGTEVATLDNVRWGNVELFKLNQILSVEVDGSGTPVAIGDKLSLKAASKTVFVVDNTNGAFEAQEVATAASIRIKAKVVAL